MNLPVSIVIRSYRERTLDVVKKIAEDQVGTAQVAVVSELQPFSEAVKRSFQLGLEMGQPWTITLDADIYLAEGAVSQMVRQMEKLPEDTFIYQGTVFDKFFLRNRYGGPHFYRTDYLEKALKLINENPDDLRAESSVYKKMAEEGFHFYNDVECYGMHDFDQYYYDVFRKFVLHAHKHRKLIPHFVKVWQPLMLDEFDYKVAMAGLTTGVLLKEVENRYDFARQHFQIVRDQYGFAEKEDLSTDLELLPIRQWIEKIRNEARTKGVEMQDPTRIKYTKKTPLTVRERIYRKLTAYFK